LPDVHIPAYCSALFYATIDPMIASRISAFLILFSLVVGLAIFWESGWGMQRGLEWIRYSPTATNTATSEFRAEPLSGPTPLTVGFSANIKSAGTQCGEYPGYSIDFGDGQVRQAGFTLDSCDGPIWSHVYTSAGMYTVKLLQAGRVINTETITVSPGRAVTTFYASPTSGRAPLTAHFTIKGQGGYQLDFGDGNMVKPNICMEGPLCTPYTIDHTYPVGEFKVRLKTSEGFFIGGYNIFAD